MRDSSPPSPLNHAAPGPPADAAGSHALILADSAQRIIAINEAMSRLCGYGARELAGQPVTVLASTAFAAPRPGPSPAVGKAGGAPMRQIQIRCADASLLSVQLQVYTFAGNGEPLYLGCVSVDESVAAIEPADLRRNPPAPAALPQALASISHDLRNSMNAVLGMSRLGAQIHASAERGVLRSYFEIIERAGSRMMSVLNELIDLGKLDAGSLVPHSSTQDVDALLRQVCAEHLSLFDEKAVQLRLVRSPSPLIAETDATLIARVIGNLLSNALKHAPAQGWVEIDLRPVEQMIEVSVEDNGPGIPIAERHRLFKRFTQLPGSERSSGAGLGLAICSELLALHHGKIWVETGRTRGARFIFRLPAHAVPVHPPSSVPAAPSRDDAYAGARAD